MEKLLPPIRAALGQDGPGQPAGPQEEAKL